MSAATTRVRPGQATRCGGELAHLNHVPAILVVLGLAALLFGAAPRAVPATWVPVGYGFFVGTFGPMLQLPDAVYDVSPFTHPAEMPVETFAAGPGGGRLVTGGGVNAPTGGSGPV